METISSAQTSFTKRIFPVLWIGMLALLVVIAIAGNGWRQQPMMLVAPLIMVVIGALMFRKLIWNLADEVQDGGSYLLVRRGNIEERVQLANVMNVSFSMFSNPRRLTLRLRTPGKLGDEISFIPRMPFFGFNPFARNPVFENLIARVDRARLQARA
ncbi:MAG TPA: hypothetical protein VFP88_06225 [Rhodanobacteraceae bacterium]|nr:hypothetical protein [Rhodanobacteraceae bacterium]